MSGIGVVGGFDTTLVTTTTEACIRGTAGVSSVLAGSAGVEVSAWSQEVVSSHTGSASASAVAGAAGAVSAVEIGGATRATIGESDVDTTGGLRVLATDVADVVANAGALSAGLIAGVGGAVDFVTIDRDTHAGLSGVVCSAADATEVAAYSQALINAGVATAGGGGIVSVMGAGAVNLITGATTASIEAGSRASEINTNPEVPGGDVIVTAIDYAAIESDAGGYSGSLVAGVGASMNINVIRRDVDASIGDSSQVASGGNVRVEAMAEHFVDASTTAFAGAAAAGIAGSLSAVALGGGIDIRAWAEAQKGRRTLNGLLVLSNGIDGLLSDDVSDRAQAALAGSDLSIDAALAWDVSPAAVTASMGSARIEAGGNVTVSAERRIGALTDVGSMAVGVLVGVGGLGRIHRRGGPHGGLCGPRCGRGRGGCRSRGCDGERRRQCRPDGPDRRPRNG